jgi:hypothetical protein
MATILEKPAARTVALLVLTLAALALSAGSSALAASGSGSGGSGSGSSGGSGSGSGGDFAFGANYQSPAVGYLVRGGLLSCPTCTTSTEPRYRVTGFTLGWDGNSLGFTSLNDFSGTVSIQVSGLPADVSSETATSVSVPRRSSVSTPLRLRAASTAALGEATITVRASGGGRTHSIQVPVAIVDALPTS